MKNSSLDKYLYIYLEEVERDFDNYLSDKKRIIKIIERVCLNPLPSNEGGYGKPLGNKDNINLTGCFKIKLKHPPIRIIYKLIRDKKEMIILAISDRDDLEAYKLAYHRLIRHNL